MPYKQNKSLIYLCYIYYIFMVWVKSESQLKQFVNKINEKYQSIKIDFKFSKFIEFMDISAYIGSNNSLQITH